MEDYEGAQEIERAWREGLTPDPLLSVSEWSDRHRMLSSKASAEPGRWRTSRTPYLRAIMDCLSPTSAVERVVFMKAAQLGATEMGSNWIGYPLDVEGVQEDGTTVKYPAGFVHLPKIDAEYVQQLCAEQLVTRRDRNGFAIREWQKMRERNEALDCYVYARASASAAGLDRFEERHWRELEKQLGLAPPPEPVATPTEILATPSGGLVISDGRRVARRVVRSRWLS